MQSDHFRKQIYSPEFRQNVQKLISQNSMNQLDEELNSFLATFNIGTSVLSLRYQRNNGTVQNVSQYGFIYAALKDEILNPCRPSVACESVSGWHFREKICTTLESSQKRKRSESRKIFSDKTASCKKSTWPCTICTYRTWVSSSPCGMSHFPLRPLTYTTCFSESTTKTGMSPAALCVSPTKHARAAKILYVKWNRTQRAIDSSRNK